VSADSLSPPAQSNGKWASPEEGDSRRNSASQILTWEQKRSNHIQSEKRRRLAIRNAYTRVHHLVPVIQVLVEKRGIGANGLCRGMSKQQVVEHCEAYIRVLIQEVRSRTERLIQLEVELAKRRQLAAASFS